MVTLVARDASYSATFDAKISSGKTLRKLTIGAYVGQPEWLTSAEAWLKELWESAAPSLRASDDALWKVLRSIVILGVATLVQVMLRVFARRDFGPSVATPPMLTWGDAVFWGDWTSNILLAFMILALQPDNLLAPGRAGALFFCILATFGLSQYVRWYGTDATGNVTPSAMKISNVVGMLIIVVALFAGVDLFK